MGPRPRSSSWLRPQATAHSLSALHSFKASSASYPCRRQRFLLNESFCVFSVCWAARVVEHSWDVVSQQRDKAGRFDHHIRVPRGRDIFKRRDLAGSDCVWRDWANVFSQEIGLAYVKTGLCPVGVNWVWDRGDRFVPVNSCRVCQTPSLSPWPGTFKVNSVLLVCHAEGACDPLSRIQVILAPCSPILQTVSEWKKHVSMLVTQLSGVCLLIPIFSLNHSRYRNSPSLFWEAKSKCRWIQCHFMIWNWYYLNISKLNVRRDTGQLFSDFCTALWGTS